MSIYFELEDLPEDLRPVYSKYLETREANGTLSAEIEELGPPVDVANARIDHMLVTLAKACVIPMEVYVNLLMDCEAHLNRSLAQLRDEQARRFAAAQQAQREQIQQAREALSGTVRKVREQKGDKQIIVPPAGVNIKGIRGDSR